MATTQKKIGFFVRITPDLKKKLGRLANKNNISLAAATNIILTQYLSTKNASNQAKLSASN